MTEQLKAEAFVRSQRPALRERYMSHSAPYVVEVIPLQDWLAVLETAGDWDCRCKIEDGVMKLFASEPIICFNLTTGQPNSPEDYKNFNEITSVWHH